jgi:5-formyltetrahydrofolate cyclo-ligase
MNKAKLRLKYKDLREKLSLEELEDCSLKIANKSLELDIWDLDMYHVFLSINKLKEVNSGYLLHILFGKDKNVVVPKMKDGQLEHFLLTDTTKLKINSWGIPEPESGIAVKSKQIDVVFLPLLVFDKKGNRIGYGKGFYDRFLKDCRPDVVKVGLSCFEAEEDTIEVQPHDMKLDYCITPLSIYNFT